MSRSDRRRDKRRKKKQKMKHITPPEDLSVELTRNCPSCHRAPAQDTVKVMSFKEWILALIDDPKFWKTPKMSRSSVKLGNLFEECKAGVEIQVEDADYDKLMEVYNEPSFTFHPQIAKATAAPGSFMDALENASDSPASAGTEDEDE